MNRFQRKRERLAHMQKERRSAEAIIGDVLVAEERGSRRLTRRQKQLRERPPTPRQLPITAEQASALTAMNQALTVQRQALVASEREYEALLGQIYAAHGVKNGVAVEVTGDGPFELLVLVPPTVRS
jgi:hypothetical protein